MIKNAQTTLFSDGTLTRGDAPFNRLWRHPSQAIPMALLQVPEIAAANAAMHNFASARDRLAPPPETTSPDELAAEIARQFGAGISVDLAEAANLIAESNRVASAAADANVVIKSAGERLWAERDNALFANEPAVMEAIQEQLRGVVTQLRKAGCRQTDADPVKAIEQNRLKQHRALLEATGPFEDIRAAIRVLHTEYQFEGSNNLYLLAALIHQPLKVFPLLPIALADVRAENIETGEIVSSSSIPWPSLDPGEGETADLLGWLAEQNDDVLWAPTVSKLRASLREITADRRKVLDAANKRLLMRLTPSREHLFRGGSARAQDLDFKHDDNPRLFALEDGDRRDASTWQILRRAESLVS